MQKHKKYSISQSAIKKLAIVLFCFEMLAPSISAMLQSDYLHEATSSFNLSIPHAASVNVLLAEQLIEEERDERGNEGLRINSFYQLPILGSPQLQERVTRHSKQSAFGHTHSLLFKKNCTFLI
jgi:hypothetical protein